MQDLKSDSLVTLWRIGEEGSFSAVARETGWSQPAISKQIKSLEHLCGCALVTRTLHGVELTPAGKVLAKHGQVIAYRLTQANRELEDLKRHDSSRLKIMAPPSICSTIVAKALVRLGFGSDAEINLEQSEPPEMIENVRNGEADCAVVFRYGSIPQLIEVDDDLVFDYLGDDPLLLLTLESSSEARRYVRTQAPIPLSDLASRKWIAGCAFCQTNLTSMAHNAHFEPNITHSTDDYLVTENLVSMGMGVSIVSRLATAGGLMNHLTVCPIADPEARRIIGVVSQRGDNRPLLRKVVDVLKWASLSYLTPPKVASSD